MKKYTLIFLLFIGNLTIAQQFKTSVILSPGISGYYSSYTGVSTIKPTNDNVTFSDYFCYSGAIREEFYLPKIISFSVELDYLYTDGCFLTKNPVYQSLVPEYSNIYKYTISINSLYLPLLLKLRTKSEMNKGIYFCFGTGISYIIQTNRNVVSETSMLGGKPYNIVPVTNGNIALLNQNNNNIGMVGLLGVGKSFKIKNNTFFCEAKYSFDLNKWYYPTINDPHNSSYDFKRQCLMLNLGYTF